MTDETKLYIIDNIILPLILGYAFGYLVGSLLP